MIEAVIKERESRPFRSLYDFCKRMRSNMLNRRALENLIKAGAFDTLEPSRHGMMESVETVLRIVENDARQNLDGSWICSAPWPVPRKPPRTMIIRCPTCVSMIPASC